MTLNLIRSSDITNWDNVRSRVYYSDHANQLAVYRGQLWGAFTSTASSTDRRPFLTAIDSCCNMDIAQSTNGNWRVTGRVSVTVLNDMYWMAHQGGGNIYMGYTTTPSKGGSWSGIGSLQSGKTEDFVTEPEIVAFDGEIFVFAGAASKKLMYTRLDRNGKQITDWKRLRAGGTDFAVSTVVYRNKLYCTHVSGDAKTFYTTSLQARDGDFTPFVDVAYDKIVSAPSAVEHSDNVAYMTFRGNGNRIVLMKLDEATGNWTSPVAITSATPIGAIGIGSWGGQLYLSYALGICKSSSVTDQYESDNEVYYEKHQAQNNWQASPALNPFADTPKPKKSRWSRLLCFS